jgi:topoisomerase IV subunit A
MAKKQKKKVNKAVIENIHQFPLEEIMGDRYATYAKYVIQDRAIPDVRDGLKPVQRRIIYAMYKSGNVYRKPHRKCATSVGEVMGKYHPHGDSSIYDALAHMSQSWKYRVPLIDFQGNNGSIDGDNPAAHRYTEARLAEISEELVRDIEKETVDVQLTFDDSQIEPIVLPARFPNLLVNGAQGIAVAMATNIPPHNLTEIVQAVIYRLSHSKATIEDLRRFVKGPDFPTGGSIIDSEGLNAIYQTGHGRVEVVATTEIEYGQDATQIIIKEIPYNIVKTKLVHDLDQIRYKKVIDGIIEVRDESDHRGLRIAIDIKKDANANIILSYLLNKTDLKSGFNANMVAIVKGHPQTLDLLQFIDAYIDHQVDVVTRLSRFDLAKSKARHHIVEGLIKAVSILDEIVKTIRRSDNKASAINNLVEQYSFTEAQSEAIVNLQLYRLTNTDVTSLKNELSELEKNIDQLEALLSDRKKLDRQIIADLNAVIKKYGTMRKTQVIEEEEAPQTTVDKRDLIAKEEVMMAITRDGYIKRSSIKSYRSSQSVYPGIKDDDLLVGVGQANTLDFLIGFTNLGNYIYVPIHEIHESRWKDEGKHINYLVTLNSDEKLLKAFIVSEFRDDIHLVLATRNGQIKRTKLSEFTAIRYSRPIGCMRLLRDDEVVDVAVATGNSDLLVMTKNGHATLFNENELTSLSIKAGGVKSISSLKGHDKIVGLLSYEPEEKGKILMLTDGGHLRIFDYNYVAVTNRLGKMQYVFKSFKSDPHRLVYFRKINKKEEVIVTTALLSDRSILTIETTDFAPTPVDRYAKKNITLPRNTSILGAYNGDIVKIDNTTEVYDVIKEEDHKELEEENSGSYEQISIFDEMGD